MNVFEKMPPKFWRGVGIGPLRTKERKLVLVGAAQQAQEPDIFIDVVGLRNDGCEFTIAVGVDSEKLGQLAPADVLLGIHHQLMLAFGNLATYINCECHKDFVCKVHKPPVPN